MSTGSKALIAMLEVVDAAVLPSEALKPTRPRPFSPPPTT